VSTPRAKRARTQAGSRLVGNDQTPFAGRPLVSDHSRQKDKKRKVGKGKKEK
jgi:hypothetical protein